MVTTQYMPHKRRIFLRTRPIVCTGTPSTTRQGQLLSLHERNDQREDTGVQTILWVTWENEPREPVCYKRLHHQSCLAYISFIKNLIQLAYVDLPEVFEAAMAKILKLGLILSFEYCPH